MQLLQGNRPTLDEVQHVPGRLRGLPLHPTKLLRVLLQQAQEVLQQRQGAAIRHLLSQGGISSAGPAQWRGWDVRGQKGIPWLVAQGDVDAGINLSYTDTSCVAGRGRNARSG
jgi:hypothetical protein